MTTQNIFGINRLPMQHPAGVHGCLLTSNFGAADRIHAQPQSDREENIASALSPASCAAPAALRSQNSDSTSERKLNQQVESNEKVRCSDAHSPTAQHLYAPTGRCCTRRNFNSNPDSSGAIRIPFASICNFRPCRTGVHR